MVGREKLAMFSYLRAGIVLGLTIMSLSAAAQTLSTNGNVDMTTNARDLASRAMDYSHSEDLQGGAKSKANEAATSPPSNPLWAIPVGSLVATRQRPIFSPSRRPPPKETSASLPAAGEPLGLPLELLGAVAGRSESVAIFRDQTTKDVIKLKIGESHLGWTLHSVNGREATFIKGLETSTLLINIP